MKTACALLALSLAAAASPIYVNTVITDGQYQTALFGGAPPAVFVDAFLGYPMGTPFDHFQILPEPPDWFLSAFVDQPESADPPPYSPPMWPAYTPPIVPAPTLPCLPFDPPPAEVPEPSSLVLAGFSLASLITLVVLKRQ